MQIESVMIRASAGSADARMLRRAGAEVWMEYGQMSRGGITWQFSTWKVPARMAVSLGLMRLGDELSEITDEPEAPGRADAPAPRTTRNRQQKRSTADTQQLQPATARRSQASASAPRRARIAVAAAAV